MDLLLDAMYDGLEKELANSRYRVYTVNNLRKDEEKLGHDFNVIMHARDHKMVLITNDAEMGKACIANGFPCVLVNQKKILDNIIIPELMSLEESEKSM